MKNIKLLMITAFLSVLVSCSTFQVTNVGDGIGLAYTNLTTVAQTAAQLHDDMLITDVQADSIRGSLQEAKDGLDTATTLLAASQESEAEDRLSQAQGVLNTVIALLEASQ